MEVGSDITVTPYELAQLVHGYLVQNGCPKTAASFKRYVPPSSRCPFFFNHTPQRDERRLHHCLRSRC